MKKITFVGQYPTQENIRDGFIQRIKDIDDLFSEVHRIYLDVRIKDYFKPRRIEVGNVTIFKLNYFFHFFKIISVLFKSEIIYIHSVYNGFKIIPHLFFVSRRKRKICLELHGAFPEESKYYGELLNPYIFSLVEKWILKKSHYVVYVSSQFKDYIQYKWNFTSTVESFIIPTVASNVVKKESAEKIKEISSRFDIQDNDVVFLYSGSTKKWQKIESTLETISKIAHNPRYKFFLLTGYLEDMKRLLKKFNLDEHPRIFVLSLTPEEISGYYEIAHYGFILRDDHILNRVASPTKLFEYLSYGIIPIMESLNIGDFLQYDCEYLKVGDVTDNMHPRKSLRNIQSAQLIYKLYSTERQRLRNSILS
jgi:hypothetical protein